MQLKGKGREGKERHHQWPPSQKHLSRGPTCTTSAEVWEDVHERSYGSHLEAKNTTLEAGVALSLMETE